MAKDSRYGSGFLGGCRSRFLFFFLALNVWGCFSEAVGSVRGAAQKSLKAVPNALSIIEEEFRIGVL